MRTYIQISGFDKSGFFESVASELRESINNLDSITFIASRPEEYRKNDDYAARIFRWFHESGLGFKRYNIIDKRIEAGMQKELMRKTSCIFLLGGSTNRQLDFLTAQELIPIIKNHEGVIIGLSAGAINMSIRSIIANPLSPPTSTHIGMGLVKTTVVPHFENITDEFMRTDIFPLASEEPVYCLCDNAIIVTKGDRIRHNGTIYKVLNGTVRLLADDDLIQP